MSKGFWRKEVIEPGLARDVEAAVAEQQAIVERDPANVRAHFALGTLYHFKGDTPRAIRFFRKALELDPSYAAAHVCLGRIYAVQGNYSLAIDHACAAERLGSRELVELLERYPNLGRKK
jgi:lipopolysaccharide biosynthesis regulator YciM